MDKNTILGNIRSGVSTGILSVDDVLIELNRLMEDRICLALNKSGGKIVFTEDYPCMISCCFDQVQELYIITIQLENGLIFSCENQETQETYQLGVDDFLIGELRHVLDKIEK